jgi:hypothetical protein
MLDFRIRHRLAADVALSMPHECFHRPAPILNGSSENPAAKASFRHTESGRRIARLLATPAPVISQVRRVE